MANGLSSSKEKQAKHTGNGVLAAGPAGEHPTVGLPVHARVESDSANISRAKMPVPKASQSDVLALLQDDLATLIGMGVSIAAGYNEGKLAFILSIDGHDLDFRDGEILMDGVPVLEK